ncbi:TonB-dependent receptor plug domain-containing protein [Echinicola pacifica]|uniref:TonB-dependent receptor plug domain-containing protein n=1 Tax=Echinicola pacifica TaxID=346377 RepID=UPI0003811543|nr:TonB-dependent receptor [Echinicola pacifica]
MKRIILYTFLLLLISPKSWAKQDPLRIKLLDAKGSPIPHGIIRVPGIPAIMVDERGAAEIDIEAYQEETSLEIYAMGFDRLSVSVGELLKDPRIILQESLGQLEEYVLAATRTGQSVQDLPMPVSVLTKEKIQETGAFRLSDVLSEQTGLQLVADHGTGLQMQGLDSDYILILLDGEPLIGRSGGLFDLDRISVSNIERIEILWGPSSAIYGSEAMAGLINIITKKQEEPWTATIRGRYGSFRSRDLAAELGHKNNGWSVYGNYDHYKTDGYDLDPESLGHTKAPSQAQTAQLKLAKELGNTWKFGINGRWYKEKSEDRISASRDNETASARLSADRKEMNINPSIRFKPEEDWTFTLRNMSSYYQTYSLSEFEEDDALLDEEDFAQNYYRTELQTDYRIDDKQLLTLGIGHQLESVKATRYDEVNTFTSTYLYAQHQWNPSEKWNLVTGARMDNHSEYGRRLSPKISAQYKLTEKFSWQASLGAGYKSPDFRQLLLNFNNAAVGYYVYGSMVVEEGVSQLDDQGQIQQYLMDPGIFGDLSAENSWAINTGFRWKWSENLFVNTNFYRNQIYNLIETAAVARLSNGQFVYSYLNLNQIVTQGVEIDISYRPHPQLSFSIGYAYLDSQDQEVLQDIKDEKYFKRTAAGTTVRVVKGDYGGLFNRSRHSGNFKVNYWEQITGLNFSLRGIYRGKYGFGDVNGNQILDDASEYADGVLQVHLSIDKEFDNGIRMEAGVRNLSDAVNLYDSTNPGRTYFMGMNISLNQLLKH